ncbi:MAG: response regulator transcription factor [Betaproteobacteria bacterium]|nr:response regulator transcription factor [Betaproteobacteria bacterium]MBK7591040.1 response regulator transcription factor [Betaproteobacteria bacterium]
MEASDSELPSLLLVDDDPVLCAVMARALGSRGFDVTVAHTIEDALRVVDGEAPEYALVDLKLGEQSGLKLVAQLKAADAQTRIVVLTGHGSIPTAIEAIKLGATYYLTKPADADEVVAAFAHEGADDTLAVSSKPMSVERLEWEYIQRVLLEHGGNISATARALSMHRRTLQRKLHKRPAKA